MNISRHEFSNCETSPSVQNVVKLMNGKVMATSVSCHQQSRRQRKILSKNPIWVFVKIVRYFCVLFIKKELRRQILTKLLIQTDENPSNGSGVLSCEQTERHIDRLTNMKKLVCAFPIFVNAPKN
jgi:hypothetical protein